MKFKEKSYLTHRIPETSCLGTESQAKILSKPQSDDVQTWLFYLNLMTFEQRFFSTLMSSVVLSGWPLWRLERPVSVGMDIPKICPRW